MNRTNIYINIVRIFKAAIIGMSAGVIILCAFKTVSVIQNAVGASAAAIRQENLTSSRGEAFDSFDMANISFTVLLDGKPCDGISVAADRGFWTVPPNGKISLSLAPNTYQFTVGYENRRLIFTGEVFAELPNEFVLDVGKTPSASEMRISDISAGEIVVVPLEIEDADEVTATTLPEGVTIAKQNGKFVLLVEEGALSAGFHCFPLTAENQYGQATSYACLRIPDGREVTPIYSADELSLIQNDLSGHYVLMNDIDMSGVDNWVSIGTESYPFTGIFDGGGHEIIGFHAPVQTSEGVSFALFGYARNAELRNVVFRKPVLAPEVPSRDIGNVFATCVLSAASFETLIENSGSIGGIVNPSDGTAGGLLGNVNYCVVLGCYNSTDIKCNMLNRYLPNTGGIVGGAYYSYIANCANEGEVKGNHLSGGIAGHASFTDITRCINSGYIWGSTIVGAIPAGGIIQSNDYGTVRNSCFVRGLAAIGAHCIDGSVVSVIPISDSELRAPGKSFLGSFDGISPDWAYASLDARGPVPFGIFKEQAAAPDISRENGRITVPPAEGARYFYTLDGSDPYINYSDPEEQLSLSLKQGQTLCVFAAKQGCRDSEILTVTGEG